MRRIGSLVGLLAFLGAIPAEAKNRQEFTRREDRFALSNPGVPAVEESEWIDATGATRAAGRYAAERCR
jgi:hypothetical protein